MAQFSGFLGPSYNGRSSNFNAARSVNLYAELGTLDNTSKTPISLVGTPGVSLWAALGALPVRGFHVFNKNLYVVSGNVLYQITPAIQISVVGTLSTVIGPVIFKDNALGTPLYDGPGGNQMMLIDGSFAYLYYYSAGWKFISPFVDGGGTFPAFPIGLEYIDGYMVVSALGSIKAYASNLYDCSSGAWNALAESPIAASSDYIQAIINLHQQLWFIKQGTSEVWQDTGTAPTVGFPFQRVSSGVIDYGTPCPDGVIRSDNSIAFPATQRINDRWEFVGIVEVSGGQPVVISPQPIVYQMNRWSPWVDIIGFSFALEGHTFGVWTSPSANQTFMYDFTTQMWNEWSTYVGAPYATGRHLSNCYTVFNGYHLVGDYRNGNIYALSSGTYTDNGVPIVSMRVGPHLFDENNLHAITIESFEIDAQMGVGDPNTLINPLITLSYSDDNGATWSNDMPRSLGQVGAYKNRAIWNSLGQFHDFLPRIVMDAPCKRVISGAWIT
jgi:hypothetical protein